MFEPTDSDHDGVTFDTYDSSVLPKDNIGPILEETFMVDSVSPALLDPDFLANVLPRKVILNWGSIEKLHLAPCYSINEEYSHTHGQDLTSAILGYVIPHINLAKTCNHPAILKGMNEYQICWADLLYDIFNVSQKRLPHGMTQVHMLRMRLVCKELYHLTIDYFEQFILFDTAEVEPNRHVWDVFSQRFPYRGVLDKNDAPYKHYLKLAGKCILCGGQFPYQQGLSVSVMRSASSGYYERCKSVYSQDLLV